MEDGRHFTIVICLEGDTIVSPLDPSLGGPVTLPPGTMLTFIEGQPFPTEPSIAPIAEIERLQRATDSDHEVTIQGPLKILMSPEQVQIEPAGMVPPPSPPSTDFQQPPTPATTPVDIDVIFPQ